MKYVISIAEHHSTTGEMYNTILYADSEKEILKRFNGFFNQEKTEGHEIRFDRPEKFEEAIRLDLTDCYGDREYRTNGITIE